MPYLIVREPGQVILSIPVFDDFRAGRSDENDLTLNDPKVSRKHLQITRLDRGWVAKDLGSTHGTRVNGAKIQDHPLRDGDELQLGSVLIRFKEEDQLGTVVHHQPTAVGPLHRNVADRRLHLFYEVSRAIGSMDDTDKLLGRMLDATLEVLGCERVLVGLSEAKDGSLRRIARTRAAVGPEEIVVSRAFVEATLNRRESLILRDAAGPDAPRTVVLERIRSAMGVPLVAGARVLGFLYVDDREHAERFTPQDLDFLGALGHLTAAMLESGERYQMAAAAAEALASQTDEIVGVSAPMRQLKGQILKLGPAADTNILIRGESGSGKELVARALHAASPRKDRPLVTLNCAAIPESLIESELFGHEKGAFTGAIKDKKGKFTLADKGTLFLDEIGDLNLAAQAKVLRAIQEGEIQPVGSEKTLRVNVRILSATHKDLRKEIEATRFREDLYYRLNVVELEVPPLRERGDDIELLAHTLLKSMSAARGAGQRLQGFSPAALALLKGYGWPGNVRELRNEIERAVITTESAVIGSSDLSPRLHAVRARAAAPGGTAIPVIPVAPTVQVAQVTQAPQATPTPPPTPTVPPAPAMPFNLAQVGSLAERYAELEPTERQLIEEALRVTRGNLSEAARLLGITRVMMKRRVDRFGLSVPDE